MNNPSPSNTDRASAVGIGKTVFDSEGEPLGVVCEQTSGGFVVSASIGRPDHQRSTSGEFGEAYLMWQCMECGEMGSIESLPEACPNCGATRELLYYRTED